MKTYNVTAEQLEVLEESIRDYDSHYDSREKLIDLLRDIKGEPRYVEPPRDNISQNSGLINTGSFAKALWPGIQKWYGEEFEKWTKDVEIKVRKN